MLIVTASFVLMYTSKYVVPMAEPTVSIKCIWPSQYKANDRKDIVKHTL